MKKIVLSTIAGIAVAVAVLSIVIADMQGMNQTETTDAPRIVHIDEPIVPPASFPLSYYGTTTDTASAQGQAGYKVDTASHLPFDNSLRMTKINADKMVTLIYSPIPITDSTTGHEVLAAKGFVVIYSVIQEKFDVKQWIEQYVADAPDVRKVVTINGMQGVANEYSIVVDPDGAQLPIPAQVTFFRGNVQINLVAEMPMTELIRVAESVK